MTVYPMWTVLSQGLCLTRVRFNLNRVRNASVQGHDMRVRAWLRARLRDRLRARLRGQQLLSCLPLLDLAGGLAITPDRLDAAGEPKR